MKIEIFVVPAWIAGIQAAGMPPENIYMNLGSSTPCWNDAIGGVLLEPTEAHSSLIFKGEHQEHEVCELIKYPNPSWRS